MGAQVDALEATIQRAEAEIDELQATLSETTEPDEPPSIERTITLRQQPLNEQRQTYVELMALEPDSDAGGLAVLDDVASVTQAGRVADHWRLVGGARRRGRRSSSCGCWTGGANRGTGRRRARPRARAAGADGQPGRPADRRRGEPPAATRSHPAGPSLAQPRRERAERVNGTTRAMTTTAERTGRDHSSEPAARDAGVVEALCVAGRRDGHLLPLEEQRGAATGLCPGTTTSTCSWRAPTRPASWRCWPTWGSRGAVLPPAREVPGVSHYYGLDRPSGRLVHVHAHFRLVLGDDTTKNFWLPIEAAYLASRSRTGCCPYPPRSTSSPCWCCAWCSSTRPGMPSSSGAGPVRQRAAGTGVAAAPYRLGAGRGRRRDPPALPRRGVAGVSPGDRAGRSRFERMRAADRLVRALESCARRPRGKDTALRVARRVTWRAGPPARPPAGGQAPGRRRCRRRARGGRRRGEEHGRGGVGPLAVRAASRWSASTSGVRPSPWRPWRSSGALRWATAPVCSATWPRPRCLPGRGPPSAAWLLWHVCTARDRRRAYARAAGRPRGRWWSATAFPSPSSGRWTDRGRVFRDGPGAAWPGG